MSAGDDEQIFHYGSPRGLWAVIGGGIGCLITWAVVYASTVTGLHNGLSRLCLTAAPLLTVMVVLVAAVWIWTLSEFRAVTITPKRTEIRYLGWRVVVDNAFPGLRIQTQYGGVWVEPPGAVTVISRGFGKSEQRGNRLWIPFFQDFCLEPKRVRAALDRIAP